MKQFWIYIVFSQKNTKKQKDDNFAFIVDTSVNIN